MRLKFLRVAVIAGLAALAACNKPGSKGPEPTPTPEATPEPTPEPTPSPTPFVFDGSSRAVVFCYHQFEENSGKVPLGMAIKPAEFEAQLQALKDNGITVIPMEDFLAWRRGEKNIPAQSAVISIDDGYISGYEVAWPILKKFGYPFTMYIYTEYVKGGKLSGGKSMTWEQIAEMRDAGVDIGSHTVTHSSLTSKKGKSDEAYRQWLESEIKGSKDVLEQKLGIPIKTLAYPYGNQNELVREIARKAGYEAAFTVYGQHMDSKGDSAAIGRYAVVSTDPSVFKKAINFAAPAIAGGNTSAATDVAPPPGVITEPLHGTTISNPRPAIKVNLATLGKVDPNSVEMRISGFGLVPASYDPQSGLLSYQMHQQLREQNVMVLVSARADGKKKTSTWTFHFDPAAPPATPELAPPAAETLPAAAEDESDIPPMKPAE